MGSMAYSEYCVPFNSKPLHTYRKIRMVCVGSGFAGLTLAYKIMHELDLEDTIDLTIYERQVCIRYLTLSPSRKVADL